MTAALMTPARAYWDTIGDARARRAARAAMRGDWIEMIMAAAALKADAGAASLLKIWFAAVMRHNGGAPLADLLAGDRIGSSDSLIYLTNAQHLVQAVRLGKIELAEPALRRLYALAPIGAGVNYGDVAGFFATALNGIDGPDHMIIWYQRIMDARERICGGIA